VTDADRGADVNLARTGSGCQVGIRLAAARSRPVAAVSCAVPTATMQRAAVIDCGTAHLGDGDFMHIVGTRSVLAGQSVVGRIGECAGASLGWRGEKGGGFGPTEAARRAPRNRKNGPSAILVFRDKAPQLAKAASDETGWSVRRVTSATQPAARCRRVGRAPRGLRSSRGSGRKRDDARESRIVIRREAVLSLHAGTANAAAVPQLPWVARAADPCGPGKAGRRSTRTTGGRFRPGDIRGAITIRKPVDEMRLDCVPCAGPRRRRTVVCSFATRAAVQNGVSTLPRPRRFGKFMLVDSTRAPSDMAHGQQLGQISPGNGPLILA